MQTDHRSLRVGSVVVVSLVALAAGIFLIGNQNNLFRSKNHYRVRFATVSGLQANNPVKLSGVHVGRVERIVLPEDPGEHLLVVHIAVDERFGARVRTDSRARIKTLGLLGDKYVEITSGSPEAAEILSGGEIPAAEPTDVDQLIASGEDVVEQIVAISYSLAALLQRLERGEGVLGQLMSPLDPDQPSVPEKIYATVDSVERLIEAFETSRGPLARLVFDEQTGDKLARSVDRLEALLAQAEEGEGLVPALLTDSELRAKLETIADNLATTSAGLAELTRTLEDGEGLLPRLFFDEEYGREMTRELRELLVELHAVSAKLSDGEGTVGRLIEDPQVYEAIHDVIVGVNESKLLRWLIRNRQKAGIRKRFEDAAQNPSEPQDAPQEASEEGIEEL
ncbi:MAG: MCE family protein [bacterium]|nr:MCE family protein [bacterium]